ncbi:MAG: zinc ribbon domain-containing protein [Coprothermobacterota bacterium]|nr:zinc ribbon domain-containing protein [Coprothermobacterota bacterium]
MKRYAGLFRAVVITLVCVFALFGTMLPAAAADTTIAMELWLEVSGSGTGQMHVYIPAGNTENIDDLVNSLNSEPALSGVEKIDQGGGRYQINFTWSDFFGAFDPNSWTNNGDTVEGDFSTMVDSFTELILHLPGTILQQQGGTKVDNSTLSFKGGSTATFSFSTSGAAPSPTSSPSSSPTAGLETYDVELWVNADGSGRATITAYLPPGGNTVEDMVSSLQSEPTFSDVSKKSLGGDRYEIAFKWSDFEMAFDPGTWVASGNSVQVDFGYLSETFTETTIHLPGEITNSLVGTQLDASTIVFSSGDTTEVIFSLSASPTPTSSPTPKPTPTSPPTPTATPTPKPTTPVPTDTPPPPPTTQPSPSPSGPNPTTIPVPTSTPVPGGTPSSGLPIWAIAAIAGGAVLVVLILFLLLRGKRRPPAPPSGTPYGAPPTSPSSTPYGAPPTSPPGTPYGAPPASLPPPPTAGARFCPSCGAPVLAGAPFCATCGAAQGQTVTTRPTSPPPPPAAVTIPIPPPPVVEPVPVPPLVVETVPPPIVEPITAASPAVVEEVAKDVENLAPTLCAACGNPLVPGSRFCMSCGKAVE